MPLISDELIQKARGIDLKSFLERVEGLTFSKENYKYYRCKEHNSLVLEHKNGILEYYWNSRSQSGDIIQYVKENITGNNFRKAIEYLTSEVNKKVIDYQSDEMESKLSRKDKVKIDYADNVKRVYAYLSKTRGISATIVNELINNELINQDIRNNLVLKYVDEKGSVVGAELIGTNSSIRFKSIVKNSNEKYGFSICNGVKVKTLIVFEASLDLMSYYQLNKNALNNSLLLSLGGAEKISKIDTYIKVYREIDTIIICTDNDVAGDNAYNKIKSKYSNHNIADGREQLKSANVKDFNELLLKK